MDTKRTHISRRCRPFVASAILVIVVSAALSVAPIGTTANNAARGSASAPKNRYARADLVNPTKTRVIRISYRSHTGAMRPAAVLVPRSYRRGLRPPIPLVISPHGRGVSYVVNAHRWGNLPGIGVFAVVSPAGEGDHLKDFSWGARGQVEDLARMPAIVASEVPWLNIDRSRIYAFGGSMGGQETLMLAARHSRLLAGAAALDSLVDFPLQYRNFPRLGCSSACERGWGKPIGLALQELARREVGGTPRTAPGKYAARSPLTYAGALAASCVPLQIWWSPHDRVVVDSPRQSARLFQEIRRADGQAPVSAYVGPWQHARPFAADRLLPHALAKFGLMPPSFERELSRTEFIPPPANACSR